MRVYLQWARADPSDWEARDIVKDGDWRKLARKDEPTEGMAGTMQADVGGGFGIQTVLDPTHATADDPGWYNDACVLGTRFSADHIHIRMSNGRMTLTFWNDSAVWAGDRHAQEWTIRLPTFDAQKGRFRQNITKRMWAEDPAHLARLQAGDTVTMDWSAWSVPGPANMVMHSVWLEPALLAAHEAAKSERGLCPTSVVNDPTRTQADRDAAMLARWS